MGIRSPFSRKKKSKSVPGSPRENSGSSRSSSLHEPGNSRTLVEELGAVFKKFDMNGDGKISWSELGSIMENLGNPVTEEELQKMVKVVDLDGNGFIDLKEFIDLNTNGVDSEKAVEDLRHAFMIFDTDGNGSISPEELQAVFRSLGDDKCSIADCKKMIRGVDCDGDGLISFEEFKNMMMNSRSPVHPLQ